MRFIFCIRAVRVVQGSRRSFKAPINFTTTATADTDIPALQEDLTDILSASGELANTRAARIIAFRAEQHAVLGLAEFLEFFSESWRFVVRCEVICRRMIVGLRGSVSSQVRFDLLVYFS